MTCNSCIDAAQNSISIEPVFPDCVAEEDRVFDLGLLYFRVEGVTSITLTFTRSDGSTFDNTVSTIESLYFIHCFCVINNHSNIFRA